MCKYMYTYCHIYVYNFIYTHICIYTYIHVSPIFVWEDLNGSLWMGGRGGGSRFRTSCHRQICHVTCERVLRCVKESCHIRMSLCFCVPAHSYVTWLFPYLCVCTHAYESWRIRMCHDSYTNGLIRTWLDSVSLSIRVITHSYVTCLLYEWTHSNVTHSDVTHPEVTWTHSDVTLIRMNSFEHDMTLPCHLYE